MARPDIEPRISDLRVRCPTDCATRPGQTLGLGALTSDRSYFSFEKDDAKYLKMDDIHSIHKQRVLEVNIFFHFFFEYVNIFIISFFM